MEIIRTLHDGKTMDEVVLTDEERDAVEAALDIVKERCASERIIFKASAIRWTILGMLRDGATVDGLLDAAKTMPLYKRRKNARPVGYSY